MWLAFALGGLTPLANYDKRRRPPRETAQLFASFTDQQLSNRSRFSPCVKDTPNGKRFFRARIERR